MIKVINEASANNTQIKEWSNKFIEDIMKDPEIQELSKLPDNKNGEQAVYLEVAKNYAGDIVIEFDSYGNGGEIQIDGFDNGKPYFADNENYGQTISYEDMILAIKNEIKQSIRFEQKYNKEREEKLANAKEKLSKMSQEEKDKIVMSYLMNN